MGGTTRVPKSLTPPRPIQVEAAADGPSYHGSKEGEDPGHGVTASAWTPQVGVFGPTTGLDPRLFGEDGELRPEVRAAILDRLARATPLRVHAWLAGGSASEWAGSRPGEAAQDLDVLTGLPAGGERDAPQLNAVFRARFNEQGWRAPFGGAWDVTAYCNPQVTDDITVIRPYAAYDVTQGRWSVRPPHLPGHSLADFDPAVIAHARAVAAEARAILRMPEPLRTREARDLWEHVHVHRCTAFSAEGTGWDDVANLDEKWLAYAPGGLLGKIKELAMAPKTASWDPGGSERSGVYLRFGGWPHDERSYSPAGGYHEDGVSAYDLDREGEPSIDHGLNRGHEHDEHCDEDCYLHEDNPDNDPQDEMRGRKARAERARYYGSDNPQNAGHLVRGEMTGVGYDGEPLLKNVRRVGDWIDHRHLFIDTAGPHRLAREPGDEGYEEPEEKPPYGYRNEHTAAPRLSYWMQWAGDQPHKAVIDQAQGHFREEHPELTKPLDSRYEDEFSIGRNLDSREGTEAMRKILRAAGHPQAETAWVGPHPSPRGSSQVAVDGKGNLGAVLLPSRWHLGTVAHEAAHLVHAHQTGIDLAALARGEHEGGEIDTGVPDHVMHGPDFARHYANALDALSPGAGDDFLRHRQAAVGLIGNVRARFHKLPKEFPGSEPIRREAVAEDYRQPHQGADADDGEALHELGSKGFFPPDVYDRPYDYGGDPAAWQKMRDARGDPERKVAVYRAAPAPAHKINTGDWVTLSKDYALEHAQEQDGDHYAVLKHRVRAADLRNDGNDLHEWTYHGPVIHYPGLAHRGEGANGWRSARDFQKAVLADAPQEDKDRAAEFDRQDRAVDRSRKRDEASAMVYLHVPPGTLHAPQGGEAHHHVTLAYLPRGMSDEDFERVSGHVRDVAARHAPFKGTFGGTGTFPEGAGPLQKRTAFVPLHAPAARALHADLAHLSRARYGEFTPHATTAYLLPGDRNPDSHPEASVPFTHVHVRRGTEVRSYPLTGPNRTEAALLDPRWREVQQMNGWTWDPTPPPRGKGHDTRPVSVRADEAVHDYLTRRSRHEGETDEELAERRADITCYGPWHKPKDRDPRVLEKYRDRALRGGPIQREAVSGYDSLIRREAAAEPTYYHVSYERFPRGHMLTPQGKGWSNFDQSSGEHVYMTPDRDRAETYRHHLWEQGHPEQHLYEVHPHGPVEPDPEDQSAVRTRHPVEVTWHENTDEDDDDDWFHHREAAAGDAGSLGTLYHSTPYEHGFPYDEWMHVGNREAAEDRARQVSPRDYGLPAGTPTTMHALRLRGRVYPRTLTDEQATNLTDHGFPVRDIDAGLPSGEGYHVFPYVNEGENPGSTSYLVHRSAIVPVGRETIRREGAAKPESWYHITDNPHFALDPHRKTAASGYAGLTGKSAMIYLDLPPGTVRPVPGGVDDHHVTVVYLGKDVSDDAFEEACRRTREAAARLAPMDGVLRGIDVFPPSSGSDGKVVAFVPAYIGGIGLLRRMLEDLSGSEHKDYRPHVTLDYLQEGDSLPAPHPAVPLRFTRVHVKRGDDIRSYPLGGGRQVTASASGPFYHGSGRRYPDGHVIDPAQPHKKLYPQSDPSKVYFSDNLWNARNWANTASPSGKGHVYEVEPVGDYEDDPHYAGPEENGIYDLSVSPVKRINVYQTGRPLRVVRRVPEEGGMQREAAAGPEFFHGSRHELPPGTHLTPDGANEAGRKYLGSGEKHVFYTDDKGLARTYGPHVYRVQPLAPPAGRGKDTKRLHDPEPGFPREYEYLSSRGFRVLDKVDPDEAQAAWDDRTARRWKSRGGQETIKSIVDREGPEGLPESARPHYRGKTAAVDLVDVYHHTDPESARAIWDQRRFEPFDEYNRVYGTNLPPGVSGATGADYGDVAVHLRVPRSIVHQWPGRPDEPEHYYDIDADDIRPEHFARVIGSE